MVRQFTDLIAAAVGDASLSNRTWVMLTEAAEGGWGPRRACQHPAELVDAARAQIAELQGAKAPEVAWVLLTEAPEGGWGLRGHAHANEELVASARAQIAEPERLKPPGRRSRDEHQSAFD